MRQLIDQTLAGRKSLGPVPITPPGRSAPGIRRGQTSPERLLITHAIEDGTGRFIGAMLVARNLGYLSHVHSTLNYSRKLAALGRLMAGVAHEVKNPLNAMTIHLELLKRKLSMRQPVRCRERCRASAGAGAECARPRRPADRRYRKAPEHHSPGDPAARRGGGGVSEVRASRRAEAAAGELAELVSDVATTVAPEAERLQRHHEGRMPAGSAADQRGSRDAAPGDAQSRAQRLPGDAQRRHAAHRLPRRAAQAVEIDVEDTGVGIPPENLSRIFDLYFTTKEKGSGIGLSMVYRIVQLHDGEVEVQSTPGAGHVSDWCSRRRKIEVREMQDTVPTNVPTVSAQHEPQSLSQSRLVLVGALAACCVAVAARAALPHDRRPVVSVRRSRCRRRRRV